MAAGTKSEPASKIKTLDMVYIGVFAVLIALCSWISIPTVVPFTLQTFGVFFTVGVLGGKRGTMAVLIYLLMGAVGLPVFAGFMGGPGVLFHTTGGYLAGFMLSALLMWGMERLLGRKPWVLALSMLFGLLLCYAFGSLWFLLVYTKSTGAIGLAAVLGWCVVPFLLPDGLKLFLAFLLSRRLSGLIK